jgi:phosphatidate cytidylyltransferase
MSDDIWRDRRDDDDFSEFGSLFDDAEPTQNVDEVDGDDERLSFGDSGSMPHWTEPATGEVPSLEASGAGEADDDHDLDVWSSFSSDAPVWKDDTPVPEERPTTVVDQFAPTGVTDQIPPTGRHETMSATGQHETMPPTGQHESVQPTGRHEAMPPTGQHESVQPTGRHEAVTREPSRITIGTDPSGMPRRPDEPVRRRRGGPSAPPPRPSAGVPPPSGRDMPAAVAVGLLLAAVFVAALMWDPRAVAVIVVAVLGLASIEFYDKVAEKGYRPAVVPGVATCVAAPLACYWLGVGTLPLVLAFGFMATSASFVGARGVEAGPMPNASITTLGVVWIGLLGSFAMLILRFSTRDWAALGASSFEVERLQHIGTDTLFLTALGVVANDTGALFIGSAAGRTPLRRWVSPNKTVEGLIGGSFFTFVVLLFVKLADGSDTWSSVWHLMALAIVISVMGPMGDLVESMFKRNLDVKDFGTLVKGHGGVLDRFDGFLFVLPGVYYLTLVLEPWTKFTPA